MSSSEPRAATRRPTPHERLHGPQPEPPPAVLRAGLAYTRFIPREELQGATPAAWRPGAFAEPPTTEVWIDLSEPVAASSAGPAEATRQAERVTSQQDRVGDRLRALGIAELARVRHARNAMLVRATSEQVVFLSGIPGVVRVRPVDTLHPPKPMP